ncbi:MAG: hypothetical protein LAT64_02085 [Phycisphaerales bacterium]|nr:hypothetical protein [Planctomycetota bacterium]MCH8507547.1 hypothetical protein [Phycisphaerales bacterium]
MPRSLTRISAACLIAGAMALASTGAAAQVRAELPTSIVEAGTIGASERSQIEAYIAELAPHATGADPEAATRARRDLVAPLSGRQPSVAFRQAYGQASSSLMRSLLNSDNPNDRIAGLRLAGNLATADGANAVRTALASDDPGVRLFAAVQARRIFEVSGAAGAAVTESQTFQLVDALVNSVEASTPAAHTQAVVRALGTGSLLRGRDMNTTRSRAAAGLARVAAAPLAALDPRDLLDHEDTLLTAASLVTRSVSEAGVAVSDEAAKAAAELGGDILSLTLRRQTGNMIPEQADADLRLVNAAESLVYFARRRHAENNRANPGGIPQTRLAELLRARDRSFRNELVRLIGPGSDFLRQFGLPDNRFIR